MRIINAPHHTLRKKAKKITKVDKKLNKFINDLSITLRKKDNPRGVGLAAPQVDKSWRIFTTQLPVLTNRENFQINYYVNPVITKHSKHQILGEEKRSKDARFEGCLSIPKIYGPVPRYDWVELEYDLIVDNELQRKKKKFRNFPARVIQHELDHLDGILFTDYLIKYDLPIYQENKTTGELEEIENREILSIF